MLRDLTTSLDLAATSLEAKHETTSLTSLLTPVGGSDAARSRWCEAGTSLEQSRVPLRGPRRGPSRRQTSLAPALLNSCRDVFEAMNGEEIGGFGHDN